MALAHRQATSSVEEAYQRSDLFKRRQIMCTRVDLTTCRELTFNILIYMGNFRRDVFSSKKQAYTPTYTPTLP